MHALNDDDRDLLLSMYLDGELEPDARAAVDAKLRDDPAWKAEYAALTASEEHVSRVVEGNWHDGELTDRVMARVQNAPRASVAEIAAVERRLRTEERPARASGAPVRGWTRWGAAAAALLAGAVALRIAFSAPPPALPAPLQVARVESGFARLVGTDQMPGAPAGELLQGQTLRGSADCARLAWADGSRIWIRSGGELTGVSARRLALKSGQLLIEVVRGAEPFTIELPDGSAAQALGTRFEVDLTLARPCVRVVEGRVRRALANQSVDAVGGQEIAPDLTLRTFDPREVCARWSSQSGQAAVAGAAVPGAAAPEPAAPWPQAGGSPAHTGFTPLWGPPGLAVRRFYPGPGTGGAQYAPAVVGARGRAYLLRRLDERHTQVYTLDLAAPSGAAWTPCGEPLAGHSQNGLVITPKGLVVAGATAGVVQAWDPASGKTAWTRDLGSSVFSLSAGHDGSIYCGTHERLVALDESGSERWSSAATQDIQAPVGVCANGQVWALSGSGRIVRYTAGGKEPVALSVYAPGKDGLFWPPVQNSPNGVWFASTAGKLYHCGTGGASAVPGAEDVSAWPLGLGVYATGKTIHFPEGPAFSLPIEGKAVALAADGAGFLYAGAKGMLYRIKRQGPATTLEAYAPVEAGEIVVGGIAISSGRLCVTTTEGVQVFE